MSRIKAIPTVYKGIQMRSRLEARIATLLDGLSIRWLYESEGFDLDGVWYLPDFWLPDLKIFIEGKGIFDESIEKPVRLAGLLEQTPENHYHVLLVDTALDTRLVYGAGVWSEVGDVWPLDLVLEVLSEPTTRSRIQSKRIKATPTRTDELQVHEKSTVTKSLQLKTTTNDEVFTCNHLMKSRCGCKWKAFLEMWYRIGQSRTNASQLVTNSWWANFAKVWGSIAIEISFQNIQQEHILPVW